MSDSQPDFKSQTQIVATLGPASNDYKTILALYRAGADFFRLNFSHGTHEDHRRTMHNIHMVRVNESADIGVLADLQGPKIRIGTFENGSIAPQAGQQIRFDLDPTPGDETRVNLPHPDVIEGLQAGYRFLLDDGNVAMRIIEKGEGYFVAEVLTGSKLSNRKGVNVPELERPIEAMTEKDKADLTFALDMGVDWVALSFVQQASDVEQARALIGNRARLLSKIEKPSALHNFPAILDASDGIMVARGDLGVEIPFEKVPGAQREMIRLTRAADKPVIVATQMLESMIVNPRATRAEIQDVYSAVLRGASAVMLSGETASGQYPVEAVTAMEAIIRAAEFEMRDPAGFMADIFRRAVHSVPQDPEPHIPLTTWEDLRKRGDQVPENLGHAVLTTGHHPSATGGVA